MTVIVGIKHENKVYIGGDSAGVAGLSLTIRADAKVFTKSDALGNQFAFGFTSSFRMGQLLRYSLSIPNLMPTADLERYLNTEFINSVRQTLKDGGYARAKEGEEIGGTFLLAVQARLFKIDSDYQVGEPLQPYDACGCGEDIALGSLFSTQGEPLQRLETALNAASQFSAGVRPPFHYVEI